MADAAPKPEEPKIEVEHSGSPPTRKTLIERLDNWEDWASWDEFYRTYSTFVWHVARKSGLSDDEASDVVQETFIGVAKNLQKKKFDTSIGSFKSFLLNQARWRILDQFRRRKKQQSREADLHFDDDDERRTAPIERCADPNGMALEKLWEKEWRDKIMDIALRRVKALVSPRQFQIFSCYVLKGWSPERVKKELGVNAAQVYLAKHRVGRILKREAARLAEGDPQ
ncbi:MAG: sigma-70 family RNA polymerase sigma factor [Verrucomicrobiales bacterium]|nr:sigma-70 family RNA polymerase sigma factor [Verrucomicrobiales bacterium]MCP5556906.1 sigma-70 family RNA polymerase sigma factor [Verrucomicrobiaceae bacterium]